MVCREVGVEEEELSYLPHNVLPSYTYRTLVNIPSYSDTDQASWGLRPSCREGIDEMQRV